MFNYFGDVKATETAEWYPIYGDLTNYKKIMVQNMNTARQSFSTILENLVAPSDQLILRTRFQYDYAPPSDVTALKPKIQHIKYDGKWYEITAVDSRQLGNFGYIKAYEYYLSLVEVNYGQDFATS